MSTISKACLDPWSFLLIKADGNVCLCCWSEPIGNVNSADLDAIVSGLKAQHLRSSLLTGELLRCCSQCPAREATTTEKLCADVEIYLNDSEKLYAVSQGKLILKPSSADPSPASSKPKPSKHWLKRILTSKLVRTLKKMLYR
jgi:hypothetical protein